MKTIKIKEVCETCIKRKTMYCPNSSKCYSTENKPYYQNGVTLLEENQQLQNNWSELKEWLSDKLYILNGILDLDVFEEQRLMDYRNVMNKVKEIESRK